MAATASGFTGCFGKAKCVGRGKDANTELSGGAPGGGVMIGGELPIELKGGGITAEYPSEYVVGSIFAGPGPWPNGGPCLVRRSFPPVIGAGSGAKAT